MTPTTLTVKAAQAQILAAQQAHAAARSPWARFRCRCAVLAAEGRLQAALEAQEAWAYRTAPNYPAPPWCWMPAAAPGTVTR